MGPMRRKLTYVRIEHDTTKFLVLRRMGVGRFTAYFLSARNNTRALANAEQYGFVISDFLSRAELLTVSLSEAHCLPASCTTEAQQTGRETPAFEVAPELARAE